MDRIILISCVGQKRATPCTAKDLYISDWFRKARRFAERSGYSWFILSAEHGLVSPDAVIAPYEKTLNTMGVRERRAWADRVLEQIVVTIPDVKEINFLAGQRYREFLLGELRRRDIVTNVPMEGLRIGEQLSWLGQA
jgi:hypothetical protein